MLFAMIKNVFLFGITVQPKQNVVFRILFRFFSFLAPKDFKIISLSIIWL